MKRVFLFFAMTVLLNGCFEARLHLKLLANGKAILNTRLALSEKLVEVAGQLKEVDPAQDLLKDVPPPVSRADVRAMKKQGAKVKQVEYTRTDTSLAIEYSVKLKTLASAKHLQGLMGAGSPAGFALLAGTDGTYTLTITRNKDGGGPMGTSKAEKEPGPPADEKTKEKVMELLLSLMGELPNLKVETIVEVPGMVVHASPKKGAKIEGMTTTWTMTGKNLMQPDNEDGPSTVQFKLPEGRSIPAKALTVVTSLND